MTKHWLIWDGECDFCKRFVATVRRRDSRRRFEIVSYHACPTPPMTPELLARAGRAMQVITADGRHLEAGRATLFILQELRWHPWLTRVVQRRPFIWLLDLGYLLVARNRRLISRATGAPSCSLPRDLSARANPGQTSNQRDEVQQGPRSAEAIRTAGGKL